MGRSLDPRLEEAEFFRALSPEQLAQVRPRVALRRLARGQVLFLEWQPADHLWAVCSGEVRLYKTSSDGTVTALELVGPGEIFGAVSALDEPSYPASAEAMAESAVWCLPAPTMLRLLESSPPLAREILRVVSRRLRQTRERLRSFAHDRVPERLARALLEAAPNGEALGTRRALAEASGTTVETAIRVLRRFEREGLVHGEVGRVRVLDEAGLRRVAGLDRD